MKSKKKIRYVSFEASAFISDVAFWLMNAEERGVYFTIILHLYENDGFLPMDKALLNSWCNCPNFENVFEKIKHKFLIKNEKISHKRVLLELKRARQISQLQRENGIRGAKSRWGDDGKGNDSDMAKASHTDSKGITKRSEEKGSEDKSSEEKRGEAQNIASHSDSSNGSSLRLASPTAGTIPKDLTLMIVNFHDELCRIFPQRTP